MYGVGDRAGITRDEERVLQGNGFIYVELHYSLTYTFNNDFST